MGNVDVVQWMITGNCNYHCSHCYLGEDNRTEPDISRLLSDIEYFKDYGIKKVVLTGGEPLIRKDLGQLLRALFDADIKVTGIITNGALVTKELLGMLRDFGNETTFSISYDGDETHGIVRNFKGAKEKTLAAFDLCREEGFETASDMTFYKGNAENLRESIKTLQEHGCSSLKVSPLIMAGNALKGNQLKMLTPSEVLDAFCEYIPFYFVDNIKMKVFLSAYFYADGKSGIWDIPVERFKMYVDDCDKAMCAKEETVPFLYVDDRLLPCAGIAGVKEARESMQKISEGGIEKAIKSPGYMNFMGYTLSEHARFNPECKECGYLKTCMGGCRIIAGIEGFGLHGKDRYFCTYFKNGYLGKVKAAVQLGKSLAALG